MATDADGYRKLVIKKAGDIVYRAGSWNGLDFSGLREDSMLRHRFVGNEDRIFYESFNMNRSVLTRCNASMDQ